MKAKQHTDDILQTCPTLKENLGRRLSTKEVAAYLGLDEDTVRKYYKEIGGIRPTGPSGRILFFEGNIIRALSWREEYAIEHYEERTNSVERESAEARESQTETFQNQEGGTGLGGERKKTGLVGEDRHGILDG